MIINEKIFFKIRGIYKKMNGVDLDLRLIVIVITLVGLGLRLIVIVTAF